MLGEHLEPALKSLSENFMAIPTWLARLKLEWLIINLGTMFSSSGGTLSQIEFN